MRRLILSIKILILIVLGFREGGDGEGWKGERRGDVVIVEGMLADENYICYINYDYAVS